MPHRRLSHIARTLALALLLTGAFATVAAAYGGARKPLRGELEWRYADYTSTPSNGEKFEASHFTQKYNLLYNLAGNVYHARGGRYDVNVGLEWWRVDSEFGDQDISLSDLKLLYSGEIVLAPAALPFRLNLFAYDRDTAAFLDEDYAGGVIDSRIVTDVFNGEHHVVGGTLTAGISNGTYLGEYRDVLARFPKLYIDFRQDDVKNLESRTPSHYRNRHLAFVSLNKKDNWFHYRLYEHDDYITPENNYVERTLQIGTIDHLLYRQWIWLTNWVRLSTDASLVTVDNYNVNNGEPEHTINYNLFFTGARNGLSFGNFNTFNRTTVADEVRRSLRVPLYVSKILSPDRAVRGQLVLEREDNRFGNPLLPDSGFDDIFASGKLETGMTAPVRLDYTLELELLEGHGSYGRGQSGRGQIEAYTNARYRLDREWLVSYSLANFRGTSPEERKVDFVEQEGIVSASRQFTPSLRLGGVQRLVYGTGQLDTSTSRRVRPFSEQGLFGSTNTVNAADGDVLHATTELNLDHSYGRLGNRFEAIFDYLQVSDRDSSSTFELRHRLNYHRQALRFKLLNKLRLGDSIGTAGFNSSQLATTRGDGDMHFESHATVEYAPARHWSVRGYLDYQWQGGGGQDSSLLLLREEARYSFFRSNGLLRRWLEFQQDFSYEQSWDDLGGGRNYGDFALTSYYYPTYNTYLRGRLGYQFYDPGATIVTYGLGVGVNFPLLKVEANYSYGLSDDDGGNVTDHRWELIVKKLI